MVCLEYKKAVLDPLSSPTFIWKSKISPELKKGVLYTIVCQSSIKEDTSAVRWRTSMKSIAIAAVSNSDQSWETASWENGAFSTSIVASMML
jgi:hypothetical protein